MPRKGGKRKKTRTHAEALLPAGISNEKDNIPRSIVARANKVTPSVAELIRDIRKVMSPYTASNLKERSYNRTKDYASVASQFGITHLLAFSETEKNIILRIAKFQNGPTLHFRIPQYCLTRLIRASQKRPFDSNAAFLTPPLIVLNNFGQSEEAHLKLLRVTLQNMFPSINVNTVRLNECRRVVLFQYVKETQIVEMRHYAIRATPVGINRNINRILQAKIPNLGNLKDISEYLQENAGYGGQSDSEAEDDPTARVELAERYVGKGNGASQQSAMKLTELGPRMNLELFKVESGLCEGDVLYHKFLTKTPEEAEKTKKRIEEMKKLKEERRERQNQNVQKKKELLEQKRQQKEERKKRKLEEYQEDHSDNDEENDNDDEDNNQEYNDINENYDDQEEEEQNEDDEIYQDEDLDDDGEDGEEYQEEDFS